MSALFYAGSRLEATNVVFVGSMGWIYTYFVSFAVSKAWSGLSCATSRGCSFAELFELFELCCHPERFRNFVEPPIAIVGWCETSLYYSDSLWCWLFHNQICIMRDCHESCKRCASQDCMILWWLVHDFEFEFFSPKIYFGTKNNIKKYFSLMNFVFTWYYSVERCFCWRKIV